MKHLKSYKLFESNHLLSDTIKDICLDLEDEGFYVINKNAPGSPVQSLRITKCDDDYIDMELCQFRPSDIKDTLDRVYHVIGNNLINTCLRLYNTHNTYYEIDMPISNKQFDYPNWRTYGIEIRFYQDGYQHGVNESEEHITPAQQEVIDDVTNMLADLTDEEYKVSVIMRDIYPSNVQDSHLNRTGIEKLLTVEIKSKTTTKNGKIAETDSMDMDIVSDYIIRLYDYMSEHQTAFNKTPATSFMSIQSIYRPGLLRNIGVVWKHLDKRNEIDYNRLLSKVGKGCGKLTIQWRPVWKVKVR